jgi:hypothetical protein
LHPWLPPWCPACPSLGRLCASSLLLSQGRLIMYRKSSHSGTFLLLKSLESPGMLPCSIPSQTKQDRIWGQEEKGDPWGDGVSCPDFRVKPQRTSLEIQAQQRSTRYLHPPSGT